MVYCSTIGQFIYQGEISVLGTLMKRPLVQQRRPPYFMTNLLLQPLYISPKAGHTSKPSLSFKWFLK